MSLFRFLARHAMGKVVNKGIGAGIDLAARGTTGTKAGRVAARSRMHKAVRLARFAANAAKAARR